MKAALNNDVVSLEGFVPLPVTPLSGDNDVDILSVVIVESPSISSQSNQVTFINYYHKVFPMLKAEGKIADTAINQQYYQNESLDIVIVTSVCNVVGNTMFRSFAHMCNN